MRSCLLLVVLLCLGCGPHVAVVEEITVDRRNRPSELPAFVARDTDWPGWRGPLHNGISVSPSAPTSWSDSSNVSWKSPIPGRGHGSPVIVGSHVYLASALERQQQQLLLAFDRETGAEVWRTVVHEGPLTKSSRMHPKGSHANGTVACDDQHIFAAFLTDDSIVASALDFEGRLIWQKKLGAFSSKFGYAPSPIIYQSFVIFAADNQGGGYLAALHRRTGEIVWRKARSTESSYSSPVVATVDGKDQLLISGSHQVSSYDPGSGELIWSCEGTTEATCGTLVWNDSTVFASGGYPDSQTLAVRADGSAQIEWTDSVKCYETSMLLVGQELYAVTDNGVVYCWDAESGDQNWKKRLGGNFSASPVFCNGEIYAANLNGETFVFRANKRLYQPTAKNLLGSDIYASPAICDGQIFLRVGRQEADRRQEWLYCLGGTALSESKAAKLGSR
ncbi:MAG: PQQ-binding-like beta-propeller repeat protein [Planctomycetaceae bacterium]|nr:PQQ-binding-like beta-propeller repeat protein [Planctomycetaceae bacterium]